jgi:SAM-dependent methyltransferase
MKTNLISLFRRGAEFFAEKLCAFSEWLVSVSHLLLMKVQWSIGENPEFFDHRIDLYYQWLRKRSSFWLERGIFGTLAMKGGRVLELGCGDGFNTRNFYSRYSQQVLACDFDPSAIKTAKRKNSGPNVEFILADIRSQMPIGKFDNVVWDASIEHFTPEEIRNIMANIKQRLTPDGILSGYTLVERHDGVKALHHHEYEFKDMDDLKRFLSPHFKNVIVFETKDSDRHNLYFWAADGVIPFSQEWSHFSTQFIPSSEEFDRPQDRVGS